MREKVQNTLLTFVYFSRTNYLIKNKHYLNANEMKCLKKTHLIKSSYGYILLKTNITRTYTKTYETE